jgi:hypothetical protein
MVLESGCAIPEMVILLPGSACGLLKLIDADAKELIVVKERINTIIKTAVSFFIMPPVLYNLFEIIS